MIRFLKQIATRLPARTQQALKRRWFAWKIQAGRFASWEPEYGLIEKFVCSGDWTLDIGANVGYYAARMSELVGPDGRVLAFEPVMESFELLVANSQLFRFANTTLLNVAVSERPSILRMCVPKWETGGSNYYEAFVNNGKEGVPAFAISVDSLNIPNRVGLAKIDTEGHELAVLHGMRRLIERDHPVLIVEANSGDVVVFLEGLGYSVTQGQNSSNYVCRFVLETSKSKE